jgi:hypothetical protein
MKTNSQIQKDVIDELQYELSIDASEIGVRPRVGSLLSAAQTKVCDFGTVSR